MTESGGRYERRTAMLTTVRQLQQGKYVVKEGWTPNYIVTDRRNVSRASIMGILIHETERGVWTLDDGTGQIELRSFDEKKPMVRVGDAVHVIARPRQYGGRLFLNYEIVRKVDPRWLEYRKRELELLGGASTIAEVTRGPTEIAAEAEAEETIVMSSPENLFARVLNIIRELDNTNNGGGADMDEVLLKANSQEAQHILNSLLEEGEIFEIRPGKVKVLE